jgi:hypothetical protein
MLSNNKTLYFTYNKSFDKTRSWLEQKGYLGGAVIMPEDVRYIVVEKRTNSDAYTIEDNEANGGKAIKRFETRDKQQIAECLDTFADGYKSDNEYIIGVYTERIEEGFYGTFDEESVPEFVENFFE